MFETEIAQLKTQFEKIGRGLSATYVGAEAALNRDADNLAERYVALHLAMMRHITKTIDIAADQMAICMEVTKTMYFYQEQISDDFDFWRKEIDTNLSFASNNRQMGFEDMQFVNAMIKDVIIPLSEAYEDDDPSLSRMRLAEHFELASYKLEMEDVVSDDFDARKKFGMDLFDEDQRPTIPQGSTPEKTLKALHLKSALNAEMAIEQNLEAGKYFMAAVQLVQSRGCPEGVSFSDEQAVDYMSRRVEKILRRCETLDDAADSCHRFIQIRLG